MNRIAVLDGFRAIAILMVVLFHYFSRWPELYPYGDAYARYFAHGKLGVLFFFMVSGFVIALTLEKCATWPEFAIKRFARLWPPMLVCSVITFLVIAALPTEPFHAAPINFLPSLTFLEPSFFGAEWMDGAYWSLFVEVRFYFWAALLYFMFGSRLHAAILVLLLVAAFLDQLTHRYIGLLFFPEYLPFFTAGVGFYAIHKGRNGWALVLASAAVAPFYSPVAQWPFHAAFFGAFAIFVTRPDWLSALAWKPLTVLGATSYSLYLLHQFAGVALISHGVSVAIVLPGMVAFSTLLYFFWERPAQDFVIGLTRRRDRVCDGDMNVVTSSPGVGSPADKPNAVL